MDATNEILAEKLAIEKAEHAKAEAARLSVLQKAAAAASEVEATKLENESLQAAIRAREAEHEAALAKLHAVCRADCVEQQMISSVLIRCVCN